MALVLPKSKPAGRTAGIFMLVLSAVILSTFLGTSVQANFFSFPRVVSFMRVFSFENEPLPFTLHHILVEKGEVPTCLLVLRDERSGQFTTTEVNPTACRE